MLSFKQVVIPIPHQNELFCCETTDDAQPIQKSFTKFEHKLLLILLGFYLIY